MTGYARTLLRPSNLAVDFQGQVQLRRSLPVPTPVGVRSSSSPQIGPARRTAIGVVLPESPNRCSRQWDL